jgi:predicted N-acetyltransferase YhbS
MQTIGRIVPQNAKRPAPDVAMTDLSISILVETLEDAIAIERLHERTFGPGRFVRTAQRIRERRQHILGLSFTAWVGTLLVGSARVTPVRIGSTPALLLGPLTVEPPFRGRGIARGLLDRTLNEARAAGHRLVVLVGDAPYYAASGFAVIPKGQITMPGPVDPGRLLVAELVAGAFEGVKGQLRPAWEDDPDRCARP